MVYETFKIIDYGRNKKAANLYDGRSQRCGKCPLWTFPKYRCNMEIYDICTNAFVEGFKKGVNWSKEQFK